MSQLSQPQYENKASRLVEQFQQFYADFGNADLAFLDALYDPACVFKDPIHSIIGAEALRTYYKSMMGQLSCRFEFIETNALAESASFQWRMLYAHPRLRGGQTLELLGASFIRFDTRITEHHDYYDMGAMLYEHIPVVGFAVNTIKKKLQVGSEL